MDCYVDPTSAQLAGIICLLPNLDRNYAFVWLNKVTVYLESSITQQYWRTVSSSQYLPNAKLDI